MHFPWKKVKSTNLSRLVNHHLHKPHDGSSLLVQTGFPTSLIDLFIKNRDKLKKKKKRNKKSPLTLLPPAPAPSPASSLSSPGSPAPSLHCSEPEDSPGRSSFEEVDVRKEVLVVLKMVLVVCFAVGSKRLTVGITVVVFSLIFADHVGRMLLHRIRGVRGCNHKEAITLTLASSSSIPEISLIDEWAEENLPTEIESNTVGELKRTKSKIGSKMKKLFQKKSRSRTQHEIQIVDETPLFPDRVDQPQIDDDPKIKHEQDSDIDTLVVKDGARRRYLVLLSLIILTGLIRGRASALVLTLSCCVLIKLSEALSRHMM